MSCYDFHENCLTQICNKSVSTFKYVLKVYTLAHGLPTLIFKWNNLKRYPLKTIYELVIKIIKSMGFLGGFIMGCRLVTCGYCNFTQKQFSKLTVFLMGLLCGLPVATEHTNRIAEYSIFTYSRVVEGLFDLLFKLEWIKPIPNAEKVIFALSMAAILVIKEYKNEYLTANYVKFLNFIFGFESGVESEKAEKDSKEKEYNEKCKAS